MHVDDLLIRNGMIVDGSGAPWYRADVAIKDGRIRAIGKLQGVAAKSVIDADGLVVSPGFIDTHSHDDLHILENKTMDVKVRQGVTTTIIGNCGFSLYPVLPDNEKLFHEYASGIFGQPEKGSMAYLSVRDFFTDVERNGVAINVGSLVAHGVLRISVMGFEDRQATPEELNRMKELLRESMRNGSLGMSMGLIYAPGSYANTQELIELSKVVAEEGGLITSHMRNEARFLLESIQEMLTIAGEAKVPLEISHLKVCGIPNFGKGKQALQMISNAKRNGIDVTFDQYPYPAGSTTMTTLMPPWALEGGIEQLLLRVKDEATRSRIRNDILEGIPDTPWEPMWKLIGWENIMICAVRTDENKKYEGKDMQFYADALGMTPVDALLHLLEAEDGQVIMVMFQQDPEEMEAIMVHDLQMFGSDGLPLKGKRAHPRLYGTYPRVLGTYVREKGVLTLEQAVYKMTYLPANRFGLLDRGLLRPGMAADITIFDPVTVEDRASYTGPAVPPVGIHSVIVNGTIVLKNHELTGQYPGKPLKRVSAGQL